MRAKKEYKKNVHTTNEWENQASKKKHLIQKAVAMY